LDAATDVAADLDTNAQTHQTHRYTSVLVSRYTVALTRSHQHTTSNKYALYSTYLNTSSSAPAHGDVRADRHPDAGDHCHCDARTDRHGNARTDRHGNARTDRHGNARTDRPRRPALARCDVVGVKVRYLVGKVLDTVPESTFF
jgi:hypothetical protein